MILKEIEAFRLAVPLRETYNLSYKSLSHFYSVVVIIRNDEREVYGESKAGIGYFWESEEEAWQFVLYHAPKILGMDPKTAFDKMLPFHIPNPCSSTSMLTALEQLFSSILDPPDEIRRIQISGLVSAFKKERIREQVERLINQGFSVFKVKVGKSIKEDIARVNFISEVVSARGKLRIDANQGYSLDDARLFVREINPQNVESFEQPFKPKEWDNFVALSNDSPIPIMMDESIYSEEDLFEVIRLRCAKLVKFKLMKVGSAKLLLDYIRICQENGVEVVLGNGACCDIGDYHEALLSQRSLTNAGDMNGFLKIETSLLEEPIPYEQGKIELRPDYRIKLNRKLMEKYKVDYRKWGI